MKPSSLPCGVCAKRRGGHRTGAWLAALLALLVLCADSRPAAALDLQSGQEVALGIDGALAVGSLVSLVGNAVDVARGQPQRGWMYSGFILGFINTAIAPILMVYGRDPEPALGLGLGATHLAIGVTNLALAVRNGVVWHRLRVAERAQPPPPPVLSVAPLLGRDSLGGTVYGLGVRVARF